MTIGDQPAAVFSHSVRGYDRVQVDEYVASLRTYAIEVEQRAVAAESALQECRRELASPGSGGISERLAAILQLANEEADEIRTRARADGVAVTEQAASDAERTINDAAQQRDAIQREVEELVANRDELFQRLLALAHEIGEATERFEADRARAAETTRVDAEFFDVEALGVEDGGDGGAGVDLEADTPIVPATDRPPEQSAKPR